MKIYCLMYHEFHCHDEVIAVYINKNKAEQETYKLENMRKNELEKTRKAFPGRYDDGIEFDGYAVEEHELIE